MNVWRTKDDTWFVLIITPDKLEAVAKAIGRPDLLTDPRFSDPAKLVANMPQLTTILDEVFCAETMAHWYNVFNGTHVTFGAVRGPQEVINDPQLRAKRHHRSAQWRRRQAYDNDQQPASGAWRRQGAREARPEDWRTQRGGSPAARL
jgi:crotonobetainyl-CoA:carnitine CoA-transferase CaiB-like acyl-CoA transferase